MRTIKIVITGPQGTGKTTLAKKILNQLTELEGSEVLFDEAVVLTSNAELFEAEESETMHEEGRVRL